MFAYLNSRRMLAELKVVEGVVSARKKRVSYSELIGGKSFSLKLDHTKPAAGKDPKDYQFVGKPMQSPTK